MIGRHKHPWLAFLCVLALFCVQSAFSGDANTGGVSTGAQRWEGVKTLVSEPKTEADIGAVAGTGSTVAEYGTGTIHKTVITLASLSVTMTDAGAAGSHGTQKIYDFPAGNILILGGSSDLSTTAGAGGIADGAALVAAVGTAAVGTGNATLTTTEADILPSYAGTLTAGVGIFDGESTTALIATFDGTATAKDAILNLAVPDADSSASDTVTVSGTVTIVWINLGDN